MAKCSQFLKGFEKKVSDILVQFLAVLNFYAIKTLVDSCSNHQRPKTTNTHTKVQRFGFSRNKKVSKSLHRWRNNQNCQKLHQRVRHFFSEKCEHSAKISISCNFFVSRWILLKSGLRSSTRFLFRFLFLGFQCYHAIANLLQSLNNMNH